jgi:hypothetical protein
MRLNDRGETVDSLYDETARLAIEENGCLAATDNTLLGISRQKL